MWCHEDLMCPPTFFSPPSLHQIPVDSSPTLSISAIDHRDTWTCGISNQGEAHRRTCSRAPIKQQVHHHCINLQCANVFPPSCFCGKDSISLHVHGVYWHAASQNTTSKWRIEVATLRGTGINRQNLSWCTQASRWTCCPVVLEPGLPEVPSTCK